MQILIIDDHQLFVDGLGFLLTSFDENLTVYTASSTHEGLKTAYAQTELDLILLDLTMPGLDGISCLKIMQQEGINIPVVILSAQEDTSYVRQAMDLGAKGFIPKSHDARAMYDALLQVWEGDTYLPDAMRAQLSGKQPICSDVVQIQLAALDIREKQFQILSFMADGQTVQQISRVMDVSPNTVKTHIKRLYQCMQVNSRVAAVSEARRLGILS